jgi:hypothetical protein
LLIREELLRQPLASIDRDVLQRTVETLRLKLALFALDERISFDQLACTLVAAVVGPRDAIYVQLGDGAIVTRGDEPGAPWLPVFWPQRGEYANETYFLTARDAASCFDFYREDGPIKDIALLTDGLQALVLDYATRSAHSKFFDFAFAHIDPAGDHAGESPATRSWLQGFLSSAAVNSRTDDDKTLVVASRNINADSRR